MKKQSVGKQVQVKFERLRDTLHGVNSSFTKIAFISKHWSVTSHKGFFAPPQAGEEWLCQVVHDTNPDNPRKGALILVPQRKLKEEVQWSIIEENVKGGRLVATSIISLGGKVLRSQSFYVANERQIPSGCPANIRQQLREQLDAIRYRKLKCMVNLESVDGSECVVVSMLEQDTGRQIFTVKSEKDVKVFWPDKLKSEVRGKLSYIKSREIIARKQEEQARQLAERIKARQEEAQLKARLAAEAEANARLAFENTFKGGKAVSVIKLTSTQKKFFGWRHKSVTVDHLSLELSNGKTVEVSSYAASGYTKDVAKLQLPCKPFLTWQEASELTEGSIISYEYPFQWVDGWLTNGVTRFPRVRPEGSEWREYPVSAIPKDCWELFLSGLEGKFAADILPWHKTVTTREKKQQVRLTERQTRIQAIIRKQMWKGNEGDYVVIGTNLIFSHQTASGVMLYLVDNPGVGAIYVFSDKEKAQELASNAITRTTAIERGYQRILHREGWEEKVEALLSGKVVLASRRKKAVDSQLAAGE